MAALRRISFRSPSLSSPRPLSLSFATSAPAPALSRRRIWTYSSILSLGVLSGFTLAIVLPKPQILSLIFPTATPHPHPSDSEEGRRHTEDIEAGLQALSLVKKYRAAVIADPTTPASTSLTADAVTTLIPAYTESRPYAASKVGPHSLSQYTLRGPGKFAIPPMVFTSIDKKSAIFFLHLGGGLCGHEGVIHGGILATIMDESLARTAFFALPNRIGVTATLNVSYRKPTFANQYVVIRTELVKSQGRKAWVKGRVETLDGELLVEAEGLFVEPKMAKFLSNSTAHEHLK